MSGTADTARVRRRRWWIQRCRAAAQLVFFGLWVTGVLHIDSLIVVASFLVGCLVGPVFCGWMCPAGLIQDIAGSIGSKLRNRFGWRALRLPHAFPYARYGLLALMIVSGLLRTDTDLAVLGMAGMIIGTAAVFVSGLFWPRAFCRVVCPAGAFLGFTNVFKLFRLRVNSSTCTGCGKCSAACPVGLDPTAIRGDRSPQCIACLRCVETCPVPGALVLSAAGRSSCVGPGDMGNTFLD